MTTRIFAYIVHEGGVAADSAAELLSAAQTMAPGQPVTAVVTGWGTELDEVCQSLGTSFAEVWKIAHEALTHPNAELVRQALVRIVPPGCILLVSHNSFGVDLSPGLSIRMNAAFVSDVVGMDGVEGGFLNVTRQELGGQVSTHVRCDV